MYAQQTIENKINVYTKLSFEFGWFYLKRRRDFYFSFAVCLYCSVNCIAKSYFQWIFRPIFQKQLWTGRAAGAKIFPLRRDENLFLDNKHKTSLLLFALRWKTRAENKWEHIHYSEFQSGNRKYVFKSSLLPNICWTASAIENKIEFSKA